MKATKKPSARKSNSFQISKTSIENKKHQKIEQDIVNQVISAIAANKKEEVITIKNEKDEIEKQQTIALNPLNIGHLAFTPSQAKDLAKALMQNTVIDTVSFGARNGYLVAQAVADALLHGNKTIKKTEVNDINLSYEKDSKKIEALYAIWGSKNSIVQQLARSLKNRLEEVKGETKSNNNAATPTVSQPVMVEEFFAATSVTPEIDDSKSTIFDYDDSKSVVSQSTDVEQKSEVSYQSLENREHDFDEINENTDVVTTPQVDVAPQESSNDNNNNNVVSESDARENAKEKYHFVMEELKQRFNSQETIEHDELFQRSDTEKEIFASPDSPPAIATEEESSDFKAVSETYQHTQPFVLLSDDDSEQEFVLQQSAAPVVQSDSESEEEFVLTLRNDESENDNNQQKSENFSDIFEMLNQMRANYRPEEISESNAQTSEDYDPFAALLESDDDSSAHVTEETKPFIETSSVAVVEQPIKEHITVVYPTYRFNDKGLGHNVVEPISEENDVKPANAFHYHSSFSDDDNNNNNNKDENTKFEFPAITNAIKTLKEKAERYEKIAKFHIPGFAKQAKRNRNVATRLQGIIDGFNTDMEYQRGSYGHSPILAAKRNMQNAVEYAYNSFNFDVKAELHENSVGMSPHTILGGERESIAVKAIMDDANLLEQQVTYDHNGEHKQSEIWIGKDAIARKLQLDQRRSISKVMFDAVKGLFKSSKKAEHIQMDNYDSDSSAHSWNEERSPSMSKTMNMLNQHEKTFTFVVPEEHAERASVNQTTAYTQARVEPSRSSEEQSTSSCFGRFFRTSAQATVLTANASVAVLDDSDSDDNSKASCFGVAADVAIAVVEQFVK